MLYRGRRGWRFEGIFKCLSKLREHPSLLVEFKYKLSAYAMCENIVIYFQEEAFFLC